MRVQPGVQGRLGPWSSSLCAYSLWRLSVRCLSSSFIWYSRPNSSSASSAICRARRDQQLYSLQELIGHLVESRHILQVATQACEQIRELPKLALVESR